ncbi:MAG: hypothetical protein A3I98_00610 [Candidatus Taylorbacteria bacterium RIFCSPLOWO2_02_FULL_45_10b]|nr:MAG: hypothetical protein A3I98_00610 [Candidatus Taylorbacteria bacterium RIFCSPLOWO2_02_FULL_45_10b]OHA44318.1 MAG: hypothetical protein A3G04_01650 [Candidatus Taylorbacteria bacterium RIFCSPLOWO2_12_FULL_44_9]
MHFIEAYCGGLNADRRFAGIQFKKRSGTGKAFPKLSIKVRKEIVSLGLPAKHDVDPRFTLRLR